MVKILTPLNNDEVVAVADFLKQREERRADMSPRAVEIAIQNKFGRTKNHVRRILNAIHECKKIWV